MKHFGLPITIILCLLGVSACKATPEESVQEVISSDTSTANKTIAIDAEKIIFSAIYDGRIDLTGEEGAFGDLESEPYSVLVSVVRNGNELVPESSQDVTRYCGNTGRFSIYLKNIKVGDWVTLQVSGLESGEAYYVYAVLSASGVQTITVSDTPFAGETAPPVSGDDADTGDAVPPSDNSDTPDASNTDETATDADSEPEPIDIGGDPQSPESDPPIDDGSSADPDIDKSSTGIPVTPVPSTPSDATWNLAGDWTIGSPVNAAASLSSDGSTDLLESLSGECTVGDTMCESKDLAGGWEYSGNWHGCWDDRNKDGKGDCDRKENIKFETQPNVSGDGYTGAVRHQFFIREESNAADTYHVEDNNRFGVVRTWTFEPPLAAGAYKLSIDALCELTDDAGTDQGACDDEGIGSILENGPLQVHLSCTDTSTTTYTLSTAVPVYGDKRRFEHEFAFPQPCTSLEVYVAIVNDVDVFAQEILSDANMVFNTPTLTNPYYRTYTIDRLMLAPLQVDLTETQKGLSDYMAILNRCTDSSLCDKPAVSLTATSTSPLLTRTQLSDEEGTRSTTRSFYELGHNPAGGAADVASSPHLFLATQPDHVLPWTVPTQAEVDRVKSGLSLYREAGTAQDTVRFFVAVRNPTSSSYSPSFTVPGDWTVRAVVYLPNRLARISGVVSYEIYPAYLDVCSGGACSEWPIPAGSARAYVVEIPAGSSTLRGQVGLSSGQSLTVSVTEIASVGTPDERTFLCCASGFDTQAKIDWDMYFNDMAKHHITDVMLYGGLFCPSGMDCTIEESASAVNQDINGDGTIADYSYIPMKKVTAADGKEMCEPIDGMWAGFASTPSAMAEIHDKAVAAGIRLGFTSNTWYIGLASSSVSAYWATMSQVGGVELGKEKNDTDPNNDDWNTIVFSDDSTTQENEAYKTYQTFKPGDLVTWNNSLEITKDFGRIYAIVPDTTDSAAMTTLTITLDVPFANAPTDLDAATNGVQAHLYKLHQPGRINNGIGLAKLGAETCALLGNPEGCGECQTLAGQPLDSEQDSDSTNDHPLLAMATPRTSEISTCNGYPCCVDDNQNKIACTVEVGYSPVQERIAQVVAEAYADLFETYGDKEVDSVIEFQLESDETKCYARGDGFEGFGEAHLLPFISILETAGLRTRGSVTIAYANREKAYREADSPNRRGLSYPSWAKTFSFSPYTLDVIDANRDTFNAYSGSVLYSGGYDWASYQGERFKLGLERAKGAIGGHSVPHNYTMHYPTNESADPARTDYAYIDYYKVENDADGNGYPDDLDGDGRSGEAEGYDFRSGTARFVADRDFLGWGTTAYHEHYGLHYAPARRSTVGDGSSSQEQIFGDESIKYAALLDGGHDYRVVRSKLAANASDMSAKLAALPWKGGFDNHMSSCSLERILDDTLNDTLTTGRLVPDLVCSCGDYQDLAECE